VVTEKKGEAAIMEIESWASRVASLVDKDVRVSVYYDGDTNTYVLRIARGNRILLFRLSDAQVQNQEREAECERTLRRKIKDLSTRHF